MPEGGRERGRKERKREGEGVDSGSESERERDQGRRGREGGEKVASLNRRSQRRSLPLKKTTSKL